PTIEIAADPSGPRREPLARIGLSPQPEIDECAPAQQPRLRLAVAVNQRRAQPLEQVGDFRRVPGAVPELVGDPPVTGEERRDALDPARAEWRRRGGR